MVGVLQTGKQELLKCKEKMSLTSPFVFSLNSPWMESTAKLSRSAQHKRLASFRRATVRRDFGFNLQGCSAAGFIAKEGWLRLYNPCCYNPTVQSKTDITCLEGEPYSDTGPGHSHFVVFHKNFSGGSDVVFIRFDSNLKDPASHSFALLPPRPGAFPAGC